MSKKGFVKLSEAEALKTIAQYEKQANILTHIGEYGVLIGVPGIILGIILDSGVLALASCAIFTVGLVSLFF